MFNKKVILIPSCHLDITFTAFRKCLVKTSVWYKELIKYIYRILNDVLNNSWTQVKWKEDKVSTRPRTSTWQVDQTNRRINHRDHRATWEKHPLARGRNNSYARNVPNYALSIKPTEVVKVLNKMWSEVKWPPRMRVDPEMRDKKNYWAFHDNHMHRTEDCIALHLLVIELLKQGLLLDILSNRAKKTWTNRKEPTESKSEGPTPLLAVKRTVNYIMEGSG